MNDLLCCFRSLGPVLPEKVSVTQGVNVAVKKDPLNAAEELSDMGSTVVPSPDSLSFYSRSSLSLTEGQLAAGDVAAEALCGGSSSKLLAYHDDVGTHLVQKQLKGNFSSCCKELCAQLYKGQPKDSVTIFRETHYIPVKFLEIDILPSNGYVTNINVCVEKKPVAVRILPDDVTLKYEVEKLFMEIQEGKKKASDLEAFFKDRFPLDTNNISLSYTMIYGGKSIKDLLKTADKNSSEFEALIDWLVNEMVDVLNAKNNSFSYEVIDVGNQKNVFENSMVNLLYSRLSNDTLNYLNCIDDFLMDNDQELLNKLKQKFKKCKNDCLEYIEKANPSNLLYAMALTCHTDMTPGNLLKGNDQSLICIDSASDDKKVFIEKELFKMIFGFQHVAVLRGDKAFETVMKTACNLFINKLKNYIESPENSHLKNQCGSNFIQFSELLSHFQRLSDVGYVIQDELKLIIDQLIDQLKANQNPVQNQKKIRNLLLRCVWNCDLYLSGMTEYKEKYGETEIIPLP